MAGLRVHGERPRWVSEDLLRQVARLGQLHLVCSHPNDKPTRLICSLIGAGWSNNNSFGIIGGPNRQSTSRPVMIRTLASQACTRLSATNRNQNNSGFCDIETILRQVDHMRPVNEGPVKLKELLDICDTEGNAQNGGGSFVIQHDSQGATFVKFEADMSQPMASRAQGGPGEIGSPIAGNNMHSFAGGRSFQLPAGPPSGF